MTIVAADAAETAWAGVHPAAQVAVLGQEMQQPAVERSPQHRDGIHRIGAIGTRTCSPRSDANAPAAPRATTANGTPGRTCGVQAWLDSPWEIKASTRTRTRQRRTLIVAITHHPVATPAGICPA